MVVACVSGRSAGVLRIMIQSSNGFQRVHLGGTHVGLEPIHAYAMVTVMQARSLLIDVKMLTYNWLYAKCAYLTCNL